jgi:hypothetical protein
MADRICGICLDEDKPTDFAIGCCAWSKHIHSWCVVQAMRTTKGHNENGKGRGRECIGGCGNPWGLETFRSAKAMVKRAHEIADASLGPLPKLKPKQAGTRKKQSQPKLPKPVPKQLQSAKQKVSLGLRYTCDGTCKKAKKGTWEGTNDASNYKRHLVSHHGADPYLPRAKKVNAEFKSVTLKWSGAQQGHGSDAAEVASAPASAPADEPEVVIVSAPISDCLGLGMYGSSGSESE